MISRAAGARLDSVRMIAAATLVTVPVLAIVWSLVSWWSILPADLPSQWSGDKVVSRLPTFVFAATALVIAGASTAFAWYAAAGPRTYDRPRRVFLLAGSVSATAAAAWLLSVAAASRPHQDIGAGALGAFAALLYGLVPFAVAASKLTSDDTGEAAEFTLESSEEIAWSRSQAAPVFAWATVVCVVVSVGLGYLPMTLAGVDGSNASVAIVASILAAMSLMLVRVRVTVDRRGLRARSASCGIPLVAVRMADVAATEVGNLEPLRWGGWGYRLGSAGTSLVLRAGPAIVVRTQSGRVVAVTTPDAEQAVGVLRALLGRRTE